MGKLSSVAKSVALLFDYVYRHFPLGVRGSVEFPGIPPSQVHDLWDKNSLALSFAAKEAQVLPNGRITFKHMKQRVDAFVGNIVLLASWEK